MKISPPEAVKEVYDQFFSAKECPHCHKMALNLTTRVCACCRYHEDDFPDDDIFGDRGFLAEANPYAESEYCEICGDRFCQGRFNLESCGHYDDAYDPDEGLSDDPLLCPICESARCGGRINPALCRRDDAFDDDFHINLAEEKLFW